MGTHDDTGRWYAAWAAQVTDHALVGLDNSGVVTAWGAGAEHLFGLPPADALGQHVSRVFTPEGRAENLPGVLISSARERGREEHAGLLRRRDGSTFWAELSLTALREDKQDVGFALVARDRTEQHETEQRLRASEVQFRTVVSQVADYAIIGLDLSGVIVSWNAGAALVKGYSATEAVGEHFSMFYTAEDRRDGLPARLLEAARTDGRVEDRGWRVRKDHTRFWADVVITALRDDEGRLRGFAKVTRDLTEQHAVEEELIRSEQRFRLLVSQVSEYAIIALDQSGVVTAWNAGAEKLKGWTSEQAVGAHHALFYTEADRRDDLPARLLREAREQGSVQHAGWRVRRDGSQFWAEVTITAVRDARGRLQGFAKVTRDSTQAHRLAEARESFVSGLTHDFRSPLTAIGGFAALLAETLEDPRLRSYASHILSGTERLSRLVELILENSRLQSGGEALVCHDVELLETVQGIVAGLAAELGERRVVVHGSPVRALVDEPALGRVVANLVGNALKYSPADTTVEVTVERTADGVRLVVGDRGRGIEAEEAALLFEQFQRGSRAQRDGGLGLGLAVVRELVAQMGGGTQLRPRVGGGTEAVVDLRAAGLEAGDLTAGARLERR